MQVLRLERDKCHHPSFCRDNCYIGSNIVLYFCGESGTTVLTGLMLTLRIYEGVSFITAIFQLAQAKQPVTKGGSRVHLCLKEMKELIDPFCTALCFWGQFKISAVSRGQKVIFAGTRETLRFTGSYSHLLSIYTMLFLYSSFSYLGPQIARARRGGW